ncbi:MAG TPA: hypothetical protein VGN21_03195 [Stellaceae bacterium]|jgi:hypothetical protein
MASEIGGFEVLHFAASAAHARAAHYRDQASRLREMAEDEAIGRLRQRLIETAIEYDNLAANVLSRLSRN